MAAASAAASAFSSSSSHQGRIVFAAVLAGGLIALSLVLAKKFLGSKKKSSSSEEEATKKGETKETFSQDEVKKVEAIKEESEPESEPELELKAAANSESSDTHSSVLKVELKPNDGDQIPKRGISVSPARFLPSPTPESAPVQEVVENKEAKTTESAPVQEVVENEEAKTTESAPVQEVVENEEAKTTESAPVQEVVENKEAKTTESAPVQEVVENKEAKTTESAPVQEVVENEDAKTTESAPVQEVVENEEAKTTESAPVQEEIDSVVVNNTKSAPIQESVEVKSTKSDQPTSASQPVANELASDKPEEKPEPAEVEPTPTEESKTEKTTEQNCAKEVLPIQSKEFKLDPEAEPFLPRDSSLLQPFSLTDGSIVNEIVASGMGGESLAEPIEKEADLEVLSDEGAVASSELESENFSMDDIEELKEVAAAAVTTGPKNMEYEMHEEPLSTGSNYVVIDPDQANNNSVSPQSSESDHPLPGGQYDDAEENQKAADHDLNSDVPFDFFDLATSPNDFKPSFDFVDPNENLNVQRSSDEDIEVIDELNNQDNNDYIPDMAVEDIEEENPSDFSADDIANALDAANNNPDCIGTRQLEVLVSLILSKDYNIQQAAMAGVAKCAAFTDNQNSLRELGCPKKLAILLKSYVMSMKVGYNVSTVLISSVSNAISNMSVNEKNQIVLQETVPLLVDLTLEGEMKESALLSTLRALTNLSTTERHHGQYTRMVQHLYTLMDAGSTPVKLQALKVLVNLSCSADMVQHLLAAKAPHSLLQLLQQDAEEALVLRWTTLLANIVHTVRVNKMSQSSLPYPEKAASPETMYTAVYGVQSMGDLKSKIFLLSKHKNEDIRYQAARVYSGLVR